MRINIILFIFCTIILSVSCQSHEPVKTENLKPEDYFQKAQEYSERGDYNTALTYYYKLKEVYPDNLEKNTWASYEIAFLYHKMGDDTKALQLFDELLALYTQDKSGVLPKAPKALTEKVRENILNKDKPNTQTVKPAEKTTTK